MNDDPTTYDVRVKFRTEDPFTRRYRIGTRAAKRAVRRIQKFRNRQDGEGRYLNPLVGEALSLYRRLSIGG